MHPAKPSVAHERKRRKVTKVMSRLLLTYSWHGVGMSARTFAEEPVPRGYCRRPKFELFKTSQHFDSTAAHPEWLGENQFFHAVSFSFFVLV
jgi:hypothetical protein